MKNEVMSILYMIITIAIAGILAFNYKELEPNEFFPLFFGGLISGFLGIVYSILAEGNNK